MVKQKTKPMKTLSLFFAIIIIFISASQTKADQLAYITKKQAKETANYLKNNYVNEVVLYCGCCENVEKLKLKVLNATYRYTGYQKFYEVVLELEDKNGYYSTTAVDLAYVHINNGDEWVSLGKVMGYECDPCVKPFKLN